METYNMKTLKTNVTAPSYQKGASLLETMISLFVLAIGILGILAMQAKSMQYNQSAHVYSQAIYLANDLAERIRTNPGSVANYVGDVPDADDPQPGEAADCNSVAGCSGQDMAAADLWSWSRRLYANLPASEAKVTQKGDYLAIELSFDDSRAEQKDPEDAGATRKTYHLMVRI